MHRNIRCTVTSGLPMTQRASSLSPGCAVLYAAPYRAITRAQPRSFRSRRSLPFFAEPLPAAVLDLDHRPAIGPKREPPMAETIASAAGSDRRFQAAVLRLVARL